MKHYRYVYPDNRKRFQTEKEESARTAYPDRRRAFQPDFGAPVQMIDSRRIPMPNEEERDPQPAGRSPFASIAAFLNSINFEDLILVGLIILLISEGLDDDILILLLAYVLIS